MRPLATARSTQRVQYSTLVTYLTAILAFVAFVNNEPKGYVVAEIREMPETSRVFEHTMVYVHDISVRPDSQGHGIGKALLDAVKQRGDEKGISLLALDTWTFNEKALRFFQRYGLVPYNVRLWNKID